MRKGQEKILKNAQILNFSEQQMQMLSDENILLKELDDIYYYFCSAKRHNISPEDSIASWEETNALLKKYDCDSSQYQWLRNALLYTGYPSHSLTAPQKRAVLCLGKRFEKSQIRHCCIGVYARGLTYNLSGWHLLQPLKAILKCETDAEEYSETDLFFQAFYIEADYREMLKYNEIRDDYIYNKENSLLYMLLTEIEEL